MQIYKPDTQARFIAPTSYGIMVAAINDAAMIIISLIYKFSTNINSIALDYLALHSATLIRELL